MKGPSHPVLFQRQSGHLVLPPNRNPFFDRSRASSALCLLGRRLIVLNACFVVQVATFFDRRSALSDCLEPVGTVEGYVTWTIAGTW